MAFEIFFGVFCGVEDVVGGLGAASGGRFRDRNDKEKVRKGDKLGEGKKDIE